MKKTFLKFLSNSLEIICSTQHQLPDEFDSYLQRAWILIFGYGCPFALWSYRIDEKFNLGVWSGGEVSKEAEIFSKINKWENDDEIRKTPLFEYLGITWMEYERMIEEGDIELLKKE